MCYNISDMSTVIGASITSIYFSFFCVLCPKISTGHKKKHRLVGTFCNSGRNRLRHYFALHLNANMANKKIQVSFLGLGLLLQSSPCRGGIAIHYCNSLALSGFGHYRMYRGDQSHPKTDYYTNDTIPNIKALQSTVFQDGWAANTLDTCNH